MDLGEDIAPEIQKEPVVIWINMVQQLERLYYSLSPEAREKHNLMFHMTLGACVALKREVLDTKNEFFNEEESENDFLQPQGRVSW